MKKLTVFTPTFNRAYCLHQVYESLCRQKNHGFLWLIIDDGSTDGTKNLAEKWQNENKIEIKYIYQQNGGMHSTYNTAYKNCETELIVCIDSDDYMSEDAVNKIILFWEKNGSEEYSGLVGLDADFKNRVIGKRFPENLKSSTLEDLYQKYKIPGDKKLVYRTEILKKYPKYPSFDGENFVPHGILFLQIDKDFELLLLNEILVNVEYQMDGSTLNIFKQYIRYPKGFRYSRLIEMKFSSYVKVRFKAAIHYISSSIHLGEYNFFKNNPFYILTFFAIPFGVLLNFYIKYRNKTTIRIK
ncbi:glycosyltransferase family 2 protein [Halpernia frigidisoli]|uniref:Glycosyltransferase involved in cell wall bisynthesis n=1 Tax=Halpernia frigidisoli TaxID=1125876 RepID=A0A1I3FE23_9FLAO|nr:glycosyltransferase family 2 protein [Halpernia frigidisoli]SFI09483.1 Glycosyltransferase involved in cell wall bisynthesis [Halpernia frigidisoli]